MKKTKKRRKEYEKKVFEEEMYFLVMLRYVVFLNIIM